MSVAAEYFDRNFAAASPVGGYRGDVPLVEVALAHAVR